MSIAKLRRELIWSPNNLNSRSVYRFHSCITLKTESSQKSKTLNLKTLQMRLRTQWFTSILAPSYRSRTSRASSNFCCTFDNCPGDVRANLSIFDLDSCAYDRLFSYVISSHGIEQSQLRLEENSTEKRIDRKKIKTNRSITVNCMKNKTNRNCPCL